MSGGHSAQLVRWLGDRVGPVNDLTMSSLPWHSATFAGMRHQIAFSAAIELSTDALTECEIAIGAGFVADIAASVTRVGEAWRYRIDVLIVDEA